MTEETRRRLGRQNSIRLESPEAFAAALKRRGQAAQGLERDLLTKVPLLYGSPDMGDPGIVLAKIHQEETVRRNGGGVFQSKRARSEVRLPFECTMEALCCILFVLWMFGR